MAVMIRCGTVSLIIALLGTRGFALEWKTTTVDLDAQEGNGTVQARFPYTNPGHRAVTILKAESSCTCTTAEVANPRVEPGQSGEIRAVLDLTDRIGLQVKTVTVTTDEPGVKSVVLRLNVNIAPSVSIEPSVLDWKIGGLLERRTAEVRLSAGVPGAIIGVESRDPRAVAALERAADGRSAQVRVALLDVSRAMHAPIVVTVRVGDAQRRYSIYARVQ